MSKLPEGFTVLLTSLSQARRSAVNDKQKASVIKRELIT